MTSSAERAWTQSVDDSDFEAARKLEVGAGSIKPRLLTYSEGLSVVASWTNEFRQRAGRDEDVQMEAFTLLERLHEMQCVRIEGGIHITPEEKQLEDELILDLEIMANLS